AALGVALGVTGLAFKINDGDYSAMDVVADGLGGFLFLSCGVIAHVRRPDNRVGWLMVFVGVTYFAEDIQLSLTPRVKLVGMPLAAASVGPITHLSLAFPTGKLSSRIQRVLAALGYAVSFAIFPITRVLLDRAFGLNDDYTRFEQGMLFVGSIRVGLTAG